MLVADTMKNDDRLRFCLRSDPGLEWLGSTRQAGPPAAAAFRGTKEVWSLSQSGRISGHSNWSIDSVQWEAADLKQALGISSLEV